MKTDFMILGATKCGTTSLASSLALHPGISFCRNKEPEFFNKNYRRGMTLEQYHGLFDRRPGAIYGEASTTYSVYGEYGLDINVWKKLRDYNASLKFIYIVRNPLDRLISHYVMWYEQDYTAKPFEQAVLEEAIFFNRGRYYTQIKPFIDYFGRDRFHFVVFEDFVSDPLNEYGKVCRFLGIDDSFRPSERNFWEHKAESTFRVGHRQRRVLEKWFVIKQKYPAFTFPIEKGINLYARLHHRKVVCKPAPDTAFIEFVFRYLEDEIKGMEGLLGRDLGFWKGKFL